MPAKLSVRHQLIALALACTLVATMFASPALAEIAPGAVKLTMSAPIAVRASHAFTLRGTVAAPASPGETVTVTLALKSGAAWSVAATSAAVIGPKRTFSCSLKPAKRGHWQVSASLPASSTYATSTATAQLKAVGANVIALTFDDGPWPTSTAKIVTALRRGDAQATFFMLGSQIGSRKKIAQSVVDNGNLVGVHSWNHALMVRRSSAVNQRDLARCVKALRAATGVTAHWFRPPYGSTNSALKKVAASQGLRQVIWTVDTLDWKYRVTSSVVSRALSGARNGAIVLMHDGGGPRGATAAAVPIVIRRLRARGYDLVTLDEMAALGYKVR
ncbi:MAG: polysaccharide deacetylase family protein [Coriobacteriia bacterium]|nr:polysaccharide deacetylase family protein [Coriobacteriia bacterium]